MPIRKLLFAVALAGFVFFFACDFNKTSAQVSAQKVLVATLLHTPSIVLRPEAIAGYDGGFPFPFPFPENDSGFTFDGGFPFDGGFGFDGGSFDFDGGTFTFDGGSFSLAGGLVIDPQTVTIAFFGSRNGQGLDQTAPTPVQGATMTVSIKGGSPLTLNDQGQGAFQLTAAENSALAYDDSAAYAYTTKAGGETFIATVDSVPAREVIPQFHPMGKSFIEQPVNTEFKFRRPDLPNGLDRNLGFVLVIPISRDGTQGDFSYTNLPKTALDYLKLVVAPGQWKTTTVTIPASAFPERDKNYIILLQSAKLGHPDSDNLFIGSAILAGTADIAIVKTH